MTGLTVKVNRDGRECPARCIRDHPDDAGPWGCAGPEHRPGDFGGADGRPGTSGRTPEVAVWAWRHHGIAATHAEGKSRALALADFLDHLSYLKPAQIRARAASLREASGEISPEEAGQ